MSPEKAHTQQRVCHAPIREWVVEDTGVPPKRRKPKGHKHDKLRLLRLADIEQKLKDMPAKVAEYRVCFLSSRRLHPPLIGSTLSH